MNCRISVCVCLLFLCLVVAAAPRHAPWPGGIAVVDIDGEAQPSVTLDGRQVLVLKNGQQWTAVAGISLDADPGEPLQLIVRTSGAGDREIAVPLEDADYRVQRLTVEQKYVDPGQSALDRIFAERKIIDKALNNFRPGEIERVALQPPSPGARSSSFGSRRIFNDQPRSPHKGMDISAAEGTPIVTPLDGIVATTGNFYFNGNTVIVDHGQGLISLYCHLSQIDAHEGLAVAAGDKLGEVGATGRVTGAHLHFATYLNGTAVDPGLLLEPEDL